MVGFAGNNKDIFLKSMYSYIGMCVYMCIHVCIWIYILTKKDMGDWKLCNYIDGSNILSAMLS